MLEKMFEKICEKHALQDNSRNNPVMTRTQNSVDLNRQVNTSLSTSLNIFEHLLTFDYICMNILYCIIL